MVGISRAASHDCSILVGGEKRDGAGDSDIIDGIDLRTEKTSLTYLPI